MTYSFSNNFRCVEITNIYDETRVDRKVVDLIDFFRIWITS